LAHRRRPRRHRSCRTLRPGVDRERRHDRAGSGCVGAAEGVELMAVELLPPGQAHPGNPEWHELRREGVTASEIPVILGLSTWESPWSLWHRKRGLLDDTPAGESAYWGRHLEDAIADAAVDRVDTHGQLAFGRGGLYCHPQRRWQMATPDRLVYYDGGLAALLEIKHPRSLAGWRSAGRRGGKRAAPRSDG